MFLCIVMQKCCETYICNPELHRIYIKWTDELKMQEILLLFRNVFFFNNIIFGQQWIFQAICSNSCMQVCLWDNEQGISNFSVWSLDHLLERWNTQKKILVWISLSPAWCCNYSKSLGLSTLTPARLHLWCFKVANNFQFCSLLKQNIKPPTTSNTNYASPAAKLMKN